MIAPGCRKFIACGGAGTLDSAIAVGHIVVPDSAIRDEGTSYHYLKPAREVAPMSRALAAIEAEREDDPNLAEAENKSLRLPQDWRVRFTGDAHFAVGIE